MVEKDGAGGEKAFDLRATDAEALGEEGVEAGAGFGRGNGEVLIHESIVGGGEGCGNPPTAVGWALGRGKCRIWGYEEATGDWDNGGLP